MVKDTGREQHHCVQHWLRSRQDTRHHVFFGLDRGEEVQIIVLVVFYWIKTMLEMNGYKQVDHAERPKTVLRGDAQRRRCLILLCLHFTLISLTQVGMTAHTFRQSLIQSFYSMAFIVVCTFGGWVEWVKRELEREAQTLSHLFIPDRVLREVGVIVSYRKVLEVAIMLWTPWQKNISLFTVKYLLAWCPKCRCFGLLSKILMLPFILERRSQSWMRLRIERAWALLCKTMQSGVKDPRTCSGVNTPKAGSLRPHSEVVYATYGHILFAVWMWMCPGLHWMTAYWTDVL